MPNWCSNKLVINFTSTEAAKKFATEVEESDSLLESLKPMPDDIYQGQLGDKEREQYGDKNWYDWSLENWGTKWIESELEVVQDGKRVELTFETAWSPPQEALVDTVPQLPGFATAVLMYCEIGTDYVGFTIFDKELPRDLCVGWSDIAEYYSDVGFSEEDDWDHDKKVFITTRNNLFMDKLDETMGNLSLGG